MLTNDRTTWVPVSHAILKEIKAAENDLRLYAKAVKQNAVLVTLYPQIIEIDFDFVLKETVESLAAPKTYNPETEAIKNSVATHVNNNTLSFWDRIVNFISNLCGGDEKLPPVTNNYKSDIDLHVLWQFENIFCSNQKVIQDDLNNVAWNTSDECADKLIPIGLFCIRLPKLHFVYSCYQKLTFRYYRDCLNVIEDRVYYAYLTALGNMKIKKETISTFEVSSRISELSSDAPREYVVLSFRSYDFCLETCKVDVVSVGKDITLCNGLPMYEYFRDKIVLIQRNHLPFLGGRDFQIAHSHEDSDELKGVMDIVTTVDSGVEVKYNSKAEIVVFTLKSTTLV